MTCPKHFSPTYVGASLPPTLAAQVISVPHLSQLIHRQALLFLLTTSLSSLSTCHVHATTGAGHRGGPQITQLPDCSACSQFCPHTGPLLHTAQHTDLICQFLRTILQCLPMPFGSSPIKLSSTSLTVPAALYLALLPSPLQVFVLNWKSPLQTREAGSVSARSFPSVAHTPSGSSCLSRQVYTLLPHLQV